MFAALLTVALFSVTAIQGALADLNVFAPSVTQCQDSHISWNGTKGPYSLLVVDPTDPCGDAISDLGFHNGTSVTWKPAIVAGTPIEITVEDANGDEAWTGNITVAHSNDISCLPAALVAQLKASSAAVTPVATLTFGNTAGSPEPSVAPEPVGAANAGFNPTSGAPTTRQFSGSILALGVVAAFLAASL